MATLRLFWRLTVFASLTTGVVFRIAFEKYFLGADLNRLLALRQRWARRLLRNVGVKTLVQGFPPEQACLIVCNHRSYLDPILIIQSCNAFPVSKSELSDWPVLGLGAKMAGVLFLKREDAAHRKHTLHQIGKTIEKGHPVLLFPEGTTSDLPGMLPFKKGSFLLAERSGFQVMPVALRFADKDDFWVGKVSFLKHAAKRFRVKNINVTVIYGPVLSSASAEQLRTQASQWIESQLLAINKLHP